MSITVNDLARATGQRIASHRVKAFVEYVERNRELPPRVQQTAADAPADAALRQALDRLRREHEELLIAEEELRAQLDVISSVENAAASERSYYQDLFGLMPEALLVTDRAAVVREANAAASLMLSIAPLHLRGKPLVALVDQAHRRGFLDALAGLESGSVELLVGLHGRRGARARVHLRGTVMSDGRKVLWTTREAPGESDAADDEARARAELEALRHRLREMEAAAERDRAERDALRAEVRAKDRATALLAHELRGPMNVILGWARLLRDDANDPAQLTKALATIERQAQAQALIVNELLDASAHAVGPTRPRFEHVDVGALVRDVVESARPVTDAASVEVECFAPDGVEVVGDAARLQQVLSSLLCDVARVMPRGGHVVVRCARCYDRDRAVEVVISDGDRGLSEATLREALRRFSGADDGRSGTEPRLGLLLIERFVALHGGTLRVESDPDGRGARCRVCLPGG